MYLNSLHSIKVGYHSQPLEAVQDPLRNSATSQEHSHQRYIEFDGDYTDAELQRLVREAREVMSKHENREIGPVGWIRKDTGEYNEGQDWGKREMKR